VLAQTPRLFIYILAILSSEDGRTFPATVGLRGIDEIPRVV